MPIADTRSDLVNFPLPQLVERGYDFASDVVAAARRSPGCV
jgi:hypothetical protein